MPEKIINALTGIRTNHNVGSPDEYNYFRVMDVHNRDEQNSKKLFYSNKGEFLYHALSKRFKGKIEYLESSIKFNMKRIDEEWENLKTLSNKQALNKIVQLVSNEPTVTFTVMLDPERTDSDWSTVKKATIRRNVLQNKTSLERTE